MKILLTGGAGFIGSCYLWKLNAMGLHDVVVVDTPENPSDWPTLRSKKFKDYLNRDVLFSHLDKGSFNDIDLLVHLGACTDTTERNQDYLTKNNLEFSQQLTKWALAHQKRFHYASSAAIYGDGKLGFSDQPSTLSKLKPLNLYGESKWLFDKWLLDQKLDESVVGFRYFNVFGPNEYHKGDMRSMAVKSYEQIKKTGHVKLFASTRDGYDNGSEQRDFVYVKDVIDAMAYFLENPGQNGIFNLGTGEARSFKDLATAVFTSLRKPVTIDYIPMPEKLRDQYQYLTKADLTSLRKAGYKKQFQRLEVTVADYVQNHLMKDDPYL